MFKNSSSSPRLLFLLTLILVFTAGCQGLAGLFEGDGAPSAPIPAEEDTAADPAPEPTSTPPERAAESGEEPAAADAPSGRIAFINLEGRLATVDSEGREMRVLSPTGAFYQFPAWSPTGSSIAAIGTNREEAGVFLFEDEIGEDQEPVRLYGDRQDTPIYLYWFPDGQSVSFIARSGRELAFHLVPADGSTPAEVLATGQPFYWQWLGNNRQALIHAGSDRLSFLDLDGNENLTGLGVDGFFQAPAISAGARYFAYQEAPSAGRILQIKDLLEDEVAFETAHTGILAMGWHPQRPLLAFTSPAEPASFIGPLRMWDGEAGEPRTLVGEDVVSFFWSPDGRYIAFFTTADLGQQTFDSKLRRGRPAQQQRPFLTLGIIEVDSGAVRYLTRFTPPRIYIGQFIPFFDQYALSHRVWSPDSRFIVVPGVSDEDVPEILVVPIDGELPRVVGEGISAFWSHQ